MKADGSSESPWRYSRFRWFAAGNSVNNIGEAIFDLVLVLVVYQQTGSVWVMSVVAAMIPATLLLGPFLGAIADLRGSRIMVLTGLLVQFVTAIALTIVVTMDSLNVASVIVLNAILQVAGAMYRVGWMTGVPAMFPESPVRARGTLSSLFIATTIIGPVLVGVLLPQLGYTGLLWLDCATFIFPLAVYFSGIRPLPVSPHRGSKSVWRGLQTGIDVIRRKRVLLLLTVFLLPYEFAIAAAIPALATYHLRDTLNISASHVAWVFATMNIAALLGALSVSERKNFRPVIIVSWTVVGLAVGLIGASLPATAIVVGSLVLLMLFDGAASSAQSMMVVHYVPQEVLGRADGALRLIQGIPAVLGPLSVGVLVPLIGTQAMFATLAAVMLLTIFGLAAFRSQLRSASKEQENFA